MKSSQHHLHGIFMLLLIYSSVNFITPNPQWQAQSNGVQQNFDMQVIDKMVSITSKDGTEIAFKRTGSGPSLVLVHGGGASDHKRWEIGGVRSSLAEHFTVYAIDRRGRGKSGDHSQYDLKREYEDVAAVVESIDEPVNLLGHSLGANISLEAALLTKNIRKLILYEPAFPIENHELTPKEVINEMQALIDRNEIEEALILFMREVASLTEEEIDAFRKDPGWKSRLEAAHTLTREEQAISDYEFDSTRFEGLNMPVLLLTGSESPPIFRKSTKALHSALPNSRIGTFHGQAHIAMNTAPELFIDAVTEFVLE